MGANQPSQGLRRHLRAATYDTMFDPSAACSSAEPHIVRALGTLVPRQRHTPPRLQRAYDFRSFWALKHSEQRSEFHSFAEYLHAGLLEGDPAVTCFVPQPFLLLVLGQYYTPDCYVLVNGHRLVIEVKPGGVMDDAMRISLEGFFKIQGMEFKVITNESIVARRLEAENWIEIVHNLYAARDIDTQANELRILESIQQQDTVGITLGEIVDPGDRERTYNDEIALLRLLHRGLVHADMRHTVFDYDSVIWPCT